MPTAVWPTPVADVPQEDYLPPVEPGGLAGFFAQPDLGAEISDRFGVIAEILSGLGTGRGLGGLSASMGAMNERSAARREKRRVTTMANRLADKIESSNPELAQMIRANPAFGMELIGKRMMAKEEAQSKMDFEKSMAPFRLEQAIKEATAKGDIETAKALALKKQELELEQQSDPFYSILKGIAGGLNGGAAGTGGGGTPTVTPPQPPPPPPAPDLSIPAPAVTAGSGLGAGAGNEPAPAVPPQQPQVLPDQPQQQPPQVQQPQPLPQLEQPVLSQQYPQIAELQKTLTGIFQTPVSESDAIAFVNPKTRNAMELELTQRREARRKLLEERKYAEQQKAIADAAERAKLVEGRQYTEEAGNRRQAAFQQGLDPNQLPTQPIVGPMPQGTAQQGLDPRTVPILQSQGYSPGDFPTPAAANQAALSILNASRTEGGVGTQSDNLAKATAATHTARTAAQQSGIDTNRTTAAIDQIKSTILPDPTTGKLTPEQIQAKAALETIAGSKDPAKAFDEWRKTNEQFVKDQADIANQQGELKVKQAAETRQQTAADIEAKTNQDKADARRIYQLRQAFNAKAALNKAISIVTDPKSGRIEGVGGWMAGIVPGADREQAQGFLNTVLDIVASGALLDMRTNSPTGASLSNISNQDIDLLKDSVVSAQTALNSGKNTEFAFKQLYNHFQNIVDPLGGDRYDVDKPGWNLRPIIPEIDNPAQVQFDKERKAREKITDGDNSIEEN